MRLLRGGAAIDAENDSLAVDCLTSVLADESKRDLHLDAALELADLYLQILDDSRRPEILAAIRENELGMIYFERFVKGRTCGSRLRPMLEFVQRTD